MTGTRKCKGIGSRCLSFFVLTILFLASAIVWWHAPSYTGIEPRMDHAMFTQWVQGVVEADSLLPHREFGQTWVSALYADHSSVVGTVLRIIVPAQSMAFTLTTLGMFSGLAAIIGADFPTQVVISMICAALGLATLAFLPLTAPRLERGEAMALGLGTFALAASTAFLAIFSALGPHNFGITALLLGLVALQNHLNRANRQNRDEPGDKTFAIMLGVHGLAFYAHYTVTLLLPVISLLSMAIHPGRPWRARLSAMTLYCAFGTVLALPVVTLSIWMRLSGKGNSQDLMGLAAWTLGNGQGTGWWPFFTQALSLPGLILGLIGLVVLGLRRGWWLPALAVAVHYAWGTLINGFAQYDRTGTYIIPLLCLGMAATVMEAVARLRDRGAWRLTATLVAALLGWHLWGQYPGLAEPTKAYFWGRWLHGNWRPLIAEIETRLPDGAVLLPADYHVSHVYKSLTYPRPFRSVLVAPPLDMLTGALESGHLDDYLARHLPDGRPDSPVIVLAYASTSEADLLRLFAAIPCGRIGLCGRVTVTHLLEGTVGAPLPGFDLVAYRIDPVR